MEGLHYGRSFRYSESTQLATLHPILFITMIIIVQIIIIGYLELTAKTYNLEVNRY